MLPRNPPGLDRSKGTQVVAARCSRLTLFYDLMHNKHSLFGSAMLYGFVLGLFWAVKYVFFVWGLAYPLAQTAYTILSALTILFAYIFTKAYKVRIGGRITFFCAWRFGVLLYFFAALVVSLEHYIFYRFIAPPDFMAVAINHTIIFLVDKLKLDPQTVEALRDIPQLTPIRLTLQGIFNNICYGALFSLPVAVILSWREK